MNITKNTEMLLDNGEITSSKTVYYRLRIWVAEGYTHTSTQNSFAATVNVYGKDVAVEGANGITLSKTTFPPGSARRAMLIPTIFWSSRPFNS